MATIQGSTGLWEIVIGLEVHAQIHSRTKLFSDALTAFGAEPNAQVSLVDAALPGTLPVISQACVEQAIKTGLGFHGTIHPVSIFERKNYFYADLPQGYQISQFLHPIVTGGSITIHLSDGTDKTVNITRLHIEQDAGKSLHEHSPEHSFIDLNRAGVGLMEIVSEPEMRSSEEAAAYVKKLRTLLRYLGSCDGDMEKGNLRCDANVSVRLVGDTTLGTRCEIKNLNSFRHITRAIDYEAERQVILRESGHDIRQETRLFDAATGETRTLRSKEDAHDYRYFPDPDLPPLVVEDAWIERVRATLPELPDAKAARYIETMGLTPYDADVLVQEREIAEYFEAVAAKITPKLAANWITGELFGYLNKQGKTIADSPISAAQMASLLARIDDGTLSGKMAKQVFETMCESGGEPDAIIDAQGLRQVSDAGAIDTMIQKVMDAHPDKVAEYRAGKEKLFGFFVGQIMKESGGSLNPAMVNDALKAKL